MKPKRNLRKMKPRFAFEQTQVIRRLHDQTKLLFYLNYFFFKSYEKILVISLTL